MNKPTKDQITMVVTQFNVFYKGVSYRPQWWEYDPRPAHTIPEAEKLGRNVGAIIREFTGTKQTRIGQ
jgi:hypothetical protein